MLCDLSDDPTVATSDYEDLSRGENHELLAPQVIISYIIIISFIMIIIIIPFPGGISLIFRGIANLSKVTNAWRS